MEDRSLDATIAMYTVSSVLQDAHKSTGARDRSLRSVPDTCSKLQL